MIVKHKFQSAIADGTNASKVRASNWNDEHNFINPNYLTSSDYIFTPQFPGVNLTAGITNTITLSPVPKGVNGSDTNHYLYISGGTGNAESILITGGTAVSGSASGTITFVPANSHSGTWQIASATAGIQEAYKYALATGHQRVYVPAGSHNIYATILIDWFGFALTGSGKCISVLNWLGPDGGNCVEFNVNPIAQFCRLENLQINGRSGLTGGWGVYFNNQDYFSIHNVMVTSFPNGFHLRGCVHGDVHECSALTIKKTGGVGLRVEDGEQVINDVMINHFYVEGDTVVTGDHGTSIGIEVLICGYLSFSRPSCILCGTGMVIRGGASIDTYFGYFDHCNMGVLIQPSNDTMRITFLKCWASSSENGPGYQIYNPWLPATSPGIFGVNFIDCVSYDNYREGFFLRGGDDVKLMNCLVAGNSKAGSSAYAGIFVDQSMSNLRISDCRIGPTDGMMLANQAYGIFINSGRTCQDLIISNNNMMGNASGALSDGSAGSRKTIQGNHALDTQTVIVAATANLNLGIGGQRDFRVTGTANVTNIDPGWQGRVIKLTFTDANPGTLGGVGNVPFVRNPSTWESVILSYDGTYWV